MKPLIFNKALYAERGIYILGLKNLESIKEIMPISQSVVSVRFSHYYRYFQLFIVITSAMNYM
jgi:hypothetical protein